MSDLNAKSLFEGKSVVLFTIPGPFTPTCHNKHVPDYLKMDLKNDTSINVDEVICLSWTDGFIMQAWAEHFEEKIDNDAGKKIRFIADHLGEFTKSLGLNVYLADLGGEKVSRSSIPGRSTTTRAVWWWTFRRMFIYNGVVEKIFQPEGKNWEPTGAQAMKSYILSRENGGGGSSFHQG